MKGLSCYAVKQWPSDLPMESYIFLSFINTRKTLFFENKCLFKFFKSIIYWHNFFKYVLIYRRNSMCFFFHFLIPGKMSLSFKYFSNENNLNWWNRGNTVIAFSLCFSFCVLFPLKYSYLRIGIRCVFSFYSNNRKHVSVV